MNLRLRAPGNPFSRGASRVIPDPRGAAFTAAPASYMSIWHNAFELVRPRKLPPLELNSTPVAAPGDGLREVIWAPGTNPKALAGAVVVQCAIVAILMFAGTTQAVRAKTTRITLLAPPPIANPARSRAQQGGGGQHSQLPPLNGQLPKPLPRVFTVPLATIEHPALVMDASLIAPPDAWTAPTGPIGNPLGVIGESAGPGTRGGIGGGDQGGLGDRTGPGLNGGGDPGIYSVGAGATAPSVLSKVDPEYSEEARKAKYSGSVMLSIIVNTDGRAADIRVVRSLGMGLDEKAVEAVRNWRFRPGTNKGLPVRVRAQVEVNFRLL